MRRLGVLVLLLALLLPGQAWAESAYQTPNGPRTLSMISAELQSAGYGGPWDESSLVQAYARTTGGPVVLLGQTSTAASAAPSQGGSRTAVVFVSGLGQDPVAPNAHWNLLVSQLEAAPFNFAERDLSLFSYTDNPAGAGVPCQNALTSERQLAAYLRLLRDSGAYGRVALVGHSFGGVLDVLVAMQEPDLSSGPSPFIRSLVTVDSPLLGVNGDRASLWVSQYGQCRAMEQLNLIQQRGIAWETELAGAVQRWLGSGMRVLAVSNHSDCLYNPRACGLFWVTDGTRDEEVPSVDVNLRVTLVPDGGSQASSHDAALFDSGTVLSIANAIGYQAS